MPSGFVIAAALLSSLASLTAATPVPLSGNILNKRVCYGTLPAGQCSVELYQPITSPASSKQVSVFNNNCSYMMVNEDPPTYGQKYSWTTGNPGYIIVNSINFPAHFPTPGAPNGGATVSFNVDGKAYTQTSCTCDVEQDYGYQSRMCSCKVSC